MDVVITLALGAKVFNRFKELGIELYKASNKNIAENIKEFQRGNLAQLEEKDIFKLK